MNLKIYRGVVAPLISFYVGEGVRGAIDYTNRREDIYGNCNYSST